MVFEVSKDKLFGLSPLAGVSDLAFRRLCALNGADFAVTEMVSAKGVYYGSKHTEELMEIDPIEKNTGIQIFGSDPEIISEVIKKYINNREDIAWLDFNMGCPVPKIVRNNEGSALMGNPELVSKIIRTMVKASTKPVTVKFRLGIDETSKNYLEIGKIAEEEGASSVTLHARTAKQMYHGAADWNAIAELKDVLKIPVIGNGDVTSPEKAIEMLEKTKCDGIAIGRGAMGNPFIFRQIKEYLNSGQYSDIPVTEIIETIKIQYRNEISQKGERTGILSMRKHMSWYLSGFRNASKAKAKIFQMSSIDEIFAILDELSEAEKR